MMKTDEDGDQDARNGNKLYTTRYIRIVKHPPLSTKKNCDVSGISRTTIMRRLTQHFHIRIP